jgi:hypothetical protein
MIIIAELEACKTAAKPKYGIDVLNAKVADLAAKDIYEPLAFISKGGLGGCPADTTAYK